jgi:hypothetical protein
VLGQARVFRHGKFESLVNEENPKQNAPQRRDCLTGGQVGCIKIKCQFRCHTIIPDTVNVLVQLMETKNKGNKFCEIWELVVVRK